MDFLTASLDEVSWRICEDGIIDEAEVQALRERLLKPEDRHVTEDEAEFLFTINDAVSGNDNSQAYEDLFVECIAGFLLQDELSPGKIDKYEWGWLKAMIGDDLDLDDLEIRLLKTIEDLADELPEGFEDYLKSFDEVEYETEEDMGSSFFLARLGRSPKRWVKKIKL